jgi:heme/copper-type cytochrome/quinol oxidase subunit 2
MINNLIATLAILVKESGNEYISVISSLLVVSFMIAVAVTGITLFCVYHRRFFTRDIKTPENATAHLGSKAFLTSWTVILAIIIYSAYIITSVRPLG